MRIEIRPRVDRDLTELLEYLAQFPWSDPVARYAEIRRAILAIATNPEQVPIRVHRARSGIDLRRWNVRQFSIVYSYDPPTASGSEGTVWIRAIRHSRVENVVKGVREVPCREYASVGLVPSHAVQIDSLPGTYPVIWQTHTRGCTRLKGYW
jgi:hypothetical protein